MERVRQFLMLCGAAVCVFAGSAAFADQVFFSGLGDLPGGSYYSTAYRVSGDGSTAVGESSSGTSYPDSEAFRWTKQTGIRGLGYLEPTISHWSEAYGVSRDGSVVVGKSTMEGTRYERAFWWTQNKGMQPLPKPPGPGEVYSMARAVSANGEVVVGGVQYPTDPPVFWQAYRWIWNGQTWDMHLIPPPSGWNDLDMLARATSTDGSVVVGGPEAGYIGHLPFCWTDATGTVLLPDLNGGDVWAQARDVSPDGTVIVGRGISDLGHEACYWIQEGDNWTVYPLGMGSASGVTVVRDRIIIVGTARTAPDEPGEPFIWDNVSGMHNLRDVLVNDYHLDLTGWALLGANGISDDGMTIVGAGINPNGDIEGFIAHIPEPATMGLLALGGVVMLVRRRGLGR